MGPSSQFVSESASLQDVTGRHARQRRCLLKGCERTFQPVHCLSRYCSPTCREAARRWSQWQANRRYRASAEGKACRRRQSCRYRERRRLQQSAGESSPPQGEGYHHREKLEKNPCQRPGCYACFERSARSPLQKFCSGPCRLALRRVLLRERRWKRLLRQAIWLGRSADDGW